MSTNIPTGPTTYGAARAVIEARLDALESDSGTSGSSNLLVVSGSVTLDNGLPAGTLVGYRATGSATFTGQGGSVTLAAGAYIFERVTGGWEYRTLVEGTGLTPLAPDTTNPTAGTLAVTGVTHNAATLTVTGASDNQALHASPYAFSTDNGTTWTGYQSSNVYAATGLTPETSYTFRHRVRDASGNVSTGTAVTQPTAAAPPPSLPITDTFTAADGTPLSGRVVGGFTWGNAAAVEAWVTSAGATPLTITGGKVQSPGGGAAASMVAGVIDVGTAHKRVTAKITSPAGATSAHQIRLGLGTQIHSALNGAFINYVPGSGFNLFHGSGFTTIGATYTGAGTGAQTDTVVSIEYDGTTLTGKVNGTTFASGPVAGITGTKAGFRLPNAVVAAIDDFTVEAL